jgi:hypothetical protein
MAKRGDIKLTVRFSKSLHRRLVDYARGNSPKLSLQGAIEALLEKALGDRLGTAAIIEQAAKRAAEEAVEKLTRAGKST